jgi:hypothetical protein
VSIGTIAKRRAAACVKPIHKTPLPSTILTAAWRAHAAWTYRGVFKDLMGVNFTAKLPARALTVNLHDRSVTAKLHDRDIIVQIRGA